MLSFHPAHDALRHHASQLKSEELLNRRGMASHAADAAQKGMQEMDAWNSPQTPHNLEEETHLEHVLTQTSLGAAIAAYCIAQVESAFIPHTIMLPACADLDMSGPSCTYCTA